MGRAYDRKSFDDACTYAWTYLLADPAPNVPIFDGQALRDSHKMFGESYKIQFDEAGNLDLRCPPINYSYVVLDTSGFQLATHNQLVWSPVGTVQGWMLPLFTNPVVATW